MKWHHFKLHTQRFRRFSHSNGRGPVRRGSSKYAENVDPEATGQLGEGKTEPVASAVSMVQVVTFMVSAGIIERKLRSTKVRLFTVPCCSIILFSSEGMKKKCIWSSS